MPARLFQSLHDAAMTAANYEEWTARLDMLWSQPDCERNQLEMQTLLLLIEQYEQQIDHLTRRTP